MDDRWLALEGNDNARDLGGLPTVDGRTTRRGVLVRSDTLQELTPADVTLLRGRYGLRTVVDLRTPLEAEKEGRGLLAVEPVAYHNLPFVPDEVVVPGDPGHELIVTERREQDRVEHYLDYLRRAGGVVAPALRVLARPGAAPAVFHCAAGKDRTGVLAALLLEIAGVRREAVVADYAATNERLHRVAARLRRLPTYAADTSRRSDEDLRSDPQTMRDFLARIDAGHGGAAGWARARGVSEEQLAALRGLLRG